MIKQIIDLRKNNRWGAIRIASNLKITEYKADKVISLLEKYGEEYLENKTMEDIFPSEEKESRIELGKDRKIRELRHKYNETKKLYERALKDLKTSQERQDIIESLKEKDQTFGIHCKDIECDSKNKSSTSRAVAFIVASDWHVEEEVKPQTVNNLNCYTLEIAKERAVNFFVNGTKLINQMSSFHQIDTLVLAVLGDMISGYIHEELLEGNQCSPTQATMFVDELLDWGIQYIKNNTNLKNIVIPCCIGNHGRTDKKKKVATSYANSYEWLMYHNIAKRYKHDSKVEFIVEEGYLLNLNIFDKYRIRCHHGDYVRYGGGIGGLTIPMNKAINQWDKMEHAYLSICGHFHQFMDGGNFIVNGSLIGYNPFAVSIKAPYEEPRQAFFLLEEERGKTIVSPIHVLDKI